MQHVRGILSMLLVFFAILLLAIVCVKIIENSVYVVGQCFVTNKEGGFYRILDTTDRSYIMQAYGTYVRNGKHLPVVVSKNKPLMKIDCWSNEDKEFMDKYKKALDKLKYLRK